MNSVYKTCPTTSFILITLEEVMAGFYISNLPHGSHQPVAQNGFPNPTNEI
ncbi:MAG: hypothetical protein IPI19_16005 [Ignavibacteriales bacterium]|nr:hypothetical protein [Ignavibacteriales bacterium]